LTSEKLRRANREIFLALSVFLLSVTTDVEMVENEAKMQPKNASNLRFS